MKLKDACSLEGKLWQTWKNESEKNSEKKVKAQSCPTLCDPMDYTAHGILQARILAWVAFPFSRGYSQLRDWTQVSHIAGRFFTNWVIDLDSCIKKQRYHFANKGLHSQSFGFSSSYAWMWKLDHKEGWTRRNWCFWIVVLEKTLESTLDCK